MSIASMNVEKDNKNMKAMYEGLMMASVKANIVHDFPEVDQNMMHAFAKDAMERRRGQFNHVLRYPKGWNVHVLLNTMTWSIYCEVALFASAKPIIWIVNSLKQGLAAEQLMGLDTRHSWFVLQCCSVLLTARDGCKKSLQAVTEDIFSVCSIRMLMANKFEEATRCMEQAINVMPEKKDIFLERLNTIIAVQGLMLLSK